MARTPRPIKTRFVDGDPFDFGTHANDFLVKREESLATEVFLVRVPGRGQVPPHLHPDMEQTFVFTSGVATAVLDRDGDRVRFSCRPGDMLFVPIGWRHTVISASPEGTSYLTVNAFVPGIGRDGDTAPGHAQRARDSLTGLAQPISVTEATAIEATAIEATAAEITDTDLYRTAETVLLHAAGRLWGQDFTALDATLFDDPGSYRVKRVGPFEYVESVAPCPRALTQALGEQMAAQCPFPLYVEGSQSPLSVKPPYAGADVDVVVAIASGEQLTAARQVVAELRGFQPHLDAPLALGIVGRDWLRLPNFYSALQLGHQSPDRRWWAATEPERRAEAAERIRRGLRFAADHTAVGHLLAESLSWVGAEAGDVREWRITPRWLGLEVLDAPDLAAGQ